jgi:hypothetical protein
VDGPNPVNLQVAAVRLWPHEPQENTKSYLIHRSDKMTQTHTIHTTHITGSSGSGVVAYLRTLWLSDGPSFRTPDFPNIPQSPHMSH